MPTPRRTLGAALLGAALAAPARAHSELRRSVPPDGAALERPPERLDLHFNERVQLTALRLFRAEGGELVLPDRRTIREADQESLRLPALPPGDYRAEWRAISADGHAVGGAIRFRVLQAGEGRP